MAIVYPDEETMLDNETKVTKEIKFDPELYIYIQKLMKEQGKTFDEIVNNMIREHAENLVSPIIKYIPINEYPQSYKYNYRTNPWGTSITYCDTKSNKEMNYTSSYDNSTLFTSDYKPKRM